MIRKDPTKDLNRKLKGVKFTHFKSKISDTPKYNLNNKNICFETFCMEISENEINKI